MFKAKCEDKEVSLWKNSANMDQEAKIRELERRLDRQDRHQVIILLLILMLVITILLKVQ